MSDSVTGTGLRVALVGPTHPFKGGVAAHTTNAAHELQAAGHDVRLVSWAALYPKKLYPGEQTVPAGSPDVPVFAATERPLRWYDPLSWWRTGRSLRTADVVVLVAVIPAQVPGLMTILAAARGLSRLRRLRRRPVPRIVVIAHNVLPHETHPGGRQLNTWLLRAADAVVVHTPDQARLASEVIREGRTEITVASLPQFIPGALPTLTGPELAAARPPRADGEPLEVLALGIVRDYKGYDQLLEAAREVPEVRVTVVGEHWGAAGARLRQLAEDPALSGRVVLEPRYLAGVEIPALLAAHDVLALPYRDATASQNVVLAHVHGLPVIATRVGSFAQDVEDGVDGVLVPPDDVPALTDALRRVAAPGALDTLRAGVPARDLHTPWVRYVEALTRSAQVVQGPRVTR